MALTPCERVLAQIRHRETDFVPYTLTLEGDLPERLDAHYGSARWRDQLDNAIREVPTPNLLMDVSGPGPTVRDPYGGIWRIDRRPMHLEKPPLETPSLQGYSFPDLDELYDAAWKQTALQAIAELEDYFLVAGFNFGLFERTWVLRGFAEALADAAANPSFYGELVERVAEHQLAILDRLVELPVQGIMFSDDWGYQQGVLLGPERWRRFIKPHLARMYARVHRAGKIAISHCCGSIVDIMPDVIEIGLDVLESVQPEARGMDPYELKREYGQDIVFWGGLGSQSTIPHGNPRQIKAEVDRLCRRMGRGGGYILAPSKALQAETPVENAAAVLEAFLAQAGVHTL